MTWPTHPSQSSEVMDPTPAAAMPALAHLSRETLQEVYEPAEDTYLFVDTLHMEREWLAALQPTICVEIGGGSGCVSAALSQVLARPCAFFFTDINPRAAKACMDTAAHNGMRWADAVNTDLLGAAQDRLRGKVDVLLFNPPYVVTPHEEIEESMIARAWAGGEHGREVLDRLLPDVAGMLSDGGVFYVVAIEENKPEEICALLREGGMRSAQVLTRRRAMNERLMIIKAVK